VKWLNIWVVPFQINLSIFIPAILIKTECHAGQYNNTKQTENCHLPVLLHITVEYHFAI